MVRAGCPVDTERGGQRARQARREVLRQIRRGQTQRQSIHLRTDLDPLISCAAIETQVAGCQHRIGRASGRRLAHQLRVANQLQGLAPRQGDVSGLQRQLV